MDSTAGNWWLVLATVLQVNRANVKCLELQAALNDRWYFSDIGVSRPLNLCTVFGVVFNHL